ncbi:uncharacterized protein N7498_005992 [Penicillium cinerascens]|uniref:Uncharacterized protein n=1 Tax=Penicillium cinerascens TaxID=70096 RepID=A0A9W9T0P0_9EURO|nr:uncharacterized protein N7498_005992 [Penicillium cinerascens]KAJ5205113.1 hypothetical protein N7498_005992 [Penicillium cinerascens]
MPMDAAAPESCLSARRRPLLLAYYPSVYYLGYMGSVRGLQIGNISHLLIVVYFVLVFIIIANDLGSILADVVRERFDAAEILPADGNSNIAVRG